MREHLTIVFVLLTSAVSVQAVTIDLVTVDNPGNAADMRYNLYLRPEGIGRVAYPYQLAKYEVTAGQYCEFLNAVAKTDKYGLYNDNMWLVTTGSKIQRSGFLGHYVYSVGSDYANRPVNFVSWGDAARFANWLHNGKPTGLQNAATTEDGSYYLNGATSDAALLAVTRKANATWVIPSEDEWYKAAYHKNDGVTGNYWEYPTRSDAMPSNSLGNPTDPGNNATYYSDPDTYTIGNPYYRTEAGAHENSASPYGTFDQGGNVFEWNEAVVSYGGNRGCRGGSFNGYGGLLHASLRSHSYGYPSVEDQSIGFRLVYLIDPDYDGFPSLSDNCPWVFNPDQTDSDSDGLGDVCDNCPVVGNLDQVDTDGDGVGNVCDNCPGAFDPDQKDNDQDGLGDLCDPDADDDGIPNEADNCFVASNPDQTDSDQDGAGDACDLCPNTPSGLPVNSAGCPPRSDFDGDGDVDQADFGHFQLCLRGSQVQQTDPGCQDARLDGDSFVDQFDLGIFLNCMSGSRIPADPNCAN